VDYQVVRSGDAIETGGVRFMFIETLPQLVAGTSSEPAGFRWQWFAMGSLFTSDGGPPSKSDGALVLGEHAGEMHALLMPARGGDNIYVRLPVGELEVSAEGSSGVFKKRPRRVLLMFADGLAFSAFDVGEVMSSGRSVKKNMAGEFLDSVSGRTAPPSD
jgi:hypothetical protein